MTDKQLKKLTRKDLLQILIMQMEENEKLKKELADAKAELENRRIKSTEAGSIAMAALQLNGVFEAAEKAAQDYLESIKAMEADMKKLSGSDAQETTNSAMEKISDETKDTP